MSIIIRYISRNSQFYFALFEKFSQGTMIETGTYEELLVFSSNFAQIVKNINQYEQEKPSASFSVQQSIINTKASLEVRTDTKDTISVLENFETKQKGNVKLNVYLSYLRAGIGVPLGCLIIIILFGTQQLVAICSSWWLATWSNDEDRRHLNLTECVDIEDTKADLIHHMSDTSWKIYRNQRFFILCGKFIKIFENSCHHL